MKYITFAARGHCPKVTKRIPGLPQKEFTFPRTMSGLHASVNCSWDEDKRIYLECGADGKWAKKADYTDCDTVNRALLETSEKHIFSLIEKVAPLLESTISDSAIYTSGSLTSLR